MAAKGNKVTQEYFANLIGEDLGSALQQKIADYREYLHTSGQLYLYWNLYNTYYSEYYTLGNNTKGGSHAQYSLTSENEFKSIVDRLQTVIAQQRVAWTARAVNGDSQTAKQTILANDVLDYYLRTKGLEEQIASALTWGWLMGEGFVSATWDSQAGKIHDHIVEDDGTVIPIHEGDVRSTVFDPTCVVRDTRAQSFEASDWIITIEQRNKYDEAAKYPELADQITALSLDNSAEMDWHFQDSKWVNGNTDAIAVYHFYHKKTPACPNGRYAKLYSDALVVLSVALPYEEIPVYRFAPQERLGSPFGYTVAINLLPMQQSHDIVNNSILTNHENFGVQSVVGWRGSNLQYETLANGMTYIELDPIAGVQDPTPKGLNLLQVAADSYKYKDSIVAGMQTISGINSVARGQPPEGVTAGTALALIQSMAIQTNMPAQLRYVKFLERLGSGIVQILKEYAAVPRIAEIAGKTNRNFVREFSSKDLDKVQRVFVELGNPLTDTTAGRLSIAHDLIQGKMVSTPQQYIDVLMTGSIDNLVNADEAELLLIKKECELLSDGEPQQALELDAHELHINEHKAVLADPELRKNAALVKVVMDHINQHKAFMQPPPGAPPAPAPGAPGAPPPGAPPPPQGAPPPKPPGPVPGAPPHPAQPPGSPPIPHTPPETTAAALTSPIGAQQAAVQMGQPKLPVSPLEKAAKK